MKQLEEMKQLALKQVEVVTVLIQNFQFCAVICKKLTEYFPVHLYQLFSPNLRAKVVDSRLESVNFLRRAFMVSQRLLRLGNGYWYLGGD